MALDMPKHDVVVGAVPVANPLLVKWIGAAPVKTDAHDTLKLAKLLAAGLVPTVWVPPPVRTLRTLIGQRQRWIKQRTQARNRLQGVRQDHNLLPLEGELFTPAQRAWWLTLELSAAERLLVAQDLLALDQLAPLIDQVETAIQLQSTCEPWASEVPYLIQQTGVSLLADLTVLAAIGDISRFAHPANLSATPAWALGCIARVKPTLPGASPSKAGVSCAPPWWKRPGWQSRITHSGKPSLRTWPAASVTPRPS
jgi:transposase